jgi:hypothetical protein
VAAIHGVPIIRPATTPDPHVVARATETGVDVLHWRLLPAAAPRRRHHRRARLDVLGVAMLAGIGFTVAMLIGHLAFGTGTPADEHVKIGILVGSLVAALFTAVPIKGRDRTYRRIVELRSQVLTWKRPPPRSRQARPSSHENRQ